jgi:excisionase family DNA binding protein
VIADPHSLAWRLERVRYLGLVVGPRGTLVSRGADWTPDPTPWARAPEREGYPELDAASDSAAARVWVLDACSDALIAARARAAWRETQARESSTAADATERARRLVALLDGLRPTWAEAAATLRALADDAGAAPTYEPLSIEQAASVLGRSVDELRAAARRGEIRTVRVGRRRAVPYEEVERLARESAMFPATCEIVGK